MYQCSLLSLCKNTPGCFEQQDSPGVCQVTLSEHANFIVHFGTWWCITKLGLVAKASAVHCIVCIVSKTKVLRAKVIVNMELFFRNLTLTVNKPWRYSEVLLNIPRFSLYTHTHKHKHTHTQTHTHTHTHTHHPKRCTARTHAHTDTQRTDPKRCTARTHAHTDTQSRNTSNEMHCARTRTHALTHGSTGQ